MNMTDRSTESDNVEDFVIYKMAALIKQYEKVQRLDIANVLQDALDKYIVGEHEIEFVDGWPHIVKEYVKWDWTLSGIYAKLKSKAITATCSVDILHSVKVHSLPMWVILLHSTHV